MAGYILLIGVSVVCAVILLYLLAIMPRILNRPDKTPFMGVLYAHRGLHDNSSQAPENSMAAFKKAVDAGYGIELDVRLSKDEVPVIFHDMTLERMCGVQGKIGDYTYNELLAFSLLDTQERIPRLEDFLKMVDGKVPLIVELKVDWEEVQVCAAADALLRDYKGIYCIESFNPMALLWYRRNHNKVMRGQLSDAFAREKIFAGPLYIALENLLLNFVTKPDFIAYNHKHERVLSRRLCRKMYRSLSVAWTIQSETELKRAKSEFDLFIFDSFLPENYPKK